MPALDMLWVRARELGVGQLGGAGPAQAQFMYFGCYPVAPSPELSEAQTHFCHS